MPRVSPSKIALWSFLPHARHPDAARDLYACDLRLVSSLPASPSAHAARWHPYVTEHVATQVETL